jgi:hypothetical protein
VVLIPISTHPTVQVLVPDTAEAASVVALIPLMLFNKYQYLTSLKRVDGIRISNILFAEESRQTRKHILKGTVSRDGDLS